MILDLLSVRPSAQRSLSHENQGLTFEDNKGLLRYVVSNEGAFGVVSEIIATLNQIVVVSEHLSVDGLQFCQ